jgi:hypothetical protein
MRHLIRHITHLLFLLTILALGAFLPSTPALAAKFEVSATTVDNTRPASEPRIIVDPQDRIYVAAPPGPPGPSFVWRSEDGGQTFTFVGPGTVGASASGGSVVVGGGDCDLATDAASGLYFIDLWLGNSSTAVSHDNGASWQGQPFGTVPIQDRPWVSAQPNPGNPATVFSVTEQPGTGLFISESPAPASGEFFPVTMLEASDADRGLIGAAPAGNLVTNMKGDTYNVYSIFTGPNGGGIGVGKLAAGSLSVSTSAVKPANSAHDQTQCFPVAAVDNQVDDNLYVTWCDPVRTGDWAIRFASFNGKRWSKAVTLGHGLYPWITAGSPGHVDVAWYSAAASGWIGDPNVGARHHAVWDVDFSQSLSALSSRPRFSRPVAAARRVKTGSVCTEGTTCVSDREVGDFLSIAHDSGGRALIAFVRVPDPSPGFGFVEVTRQSGGANIR